MRHQVILELHRRDPLATGLDHVLCPVSQREEALAGESADIPDPQPSVAEPVGVLTAELRRRYPRTAYLQIADGGSVSWNDLTPRSDQPTLHGGRQPSLT